MKDSGGRKGHSQDSTNLMRSSAGLNKGKKTVVTGEKTPFLAVSYLLVFDEQEKTGLRWPWESKQYIAGDEK